jgi:branched-chain amino acid transport system substrate-binding protein
MIPRTSQVRRTRLTLSLFLLGAVALACLPAMAGDPAPAVAKLKIGLMLPFSGTYASLGSAIENGFQLYVKQQGGRLAGREVA